MKTRAEFFLPFQDSSLADRPNPLVFGTLCGEVDEYRFDFSVLQISLLYIHFLK